MGGVRAQEMAEQNALPVVNLTEDKEEDECFPLGCRCNDIPVDGLCNLCDHRRNTNA